MAKCGRRKAQMASRSRRTVGRTKIERSHVWSPRVAWRHIRGTSTKWIASTLVGAVLLVLVTLFFANSAGTAAAQASPQPFTGSVASPQVREVITLGSSDLHPRQLAYDAGRNALWFWTSGRGTDGGFDNRLYRYDIAHGQTTSWQLYSRDWSSQVHAGLAVAPDGDVWVGWNLNLIDFHPAAGIYTRYVLPSLPRYPLPAAVLGDLPANLGVTDIQVARDGTVWIARYGALSLTTFSPAATRFNEYPLPISSGDPAKLTIAPNDHVFFTTNRSACHPGRAAETIGEFDPQSRSTTVYAQGAEAIAVTPQGDLYTALEAGGPGLSRITAAEHSTAAAEHRAPVFQQRAVPFDVDDVAIAADSYGRVWVAVGGQPRIAVLDPTTGYVQQYQYAAPSVAAHPVTNQRFSAATGHSSGMQLQPGAVWLRHIVAMVTDSQGHLWYVRAGSDLIEEVAA